MKVDAFALGLVLLYGVSTSGARVAGLATVVLMHPCLYPPVDVPPRSCKACGKTKADNNGKKN